ncbi:unnamed protein product [Mytilus coruscus]|uniref:Reverse transcriptase domain-containing protein n=1 Tax=Mytilus coruscus TaxID=42192 RepID=A0A6J8BAW8_MYTCO|nr:unnamed protein product [Mytilus coruscus]
MAVLATYLRKLKIQIFMYLDDWLISNSDRTALVNQMDFVLRLVQDLGLLVNQKKSNLIPTQHTEYMGALFNLEKGIVTPTETRFQSILEIIHALLNSQQLQAVVIFKITGSDGFMHLPNTHGQITHWLELKAVQLALQEAVQIVKDKNILFTFQATSRCSFEEGTFFQDDRVDNQNYDSKFDISETGNSKYRSVCSLLLSGSRHSSISSRCSNCKLERHNILIDIPIKLPLLPDLLSQIHNRIQIFHKSPETLNLLAWKLSNCAKSQKDFLKKLQKLWQMPEKTSTQTVYDARLGIYDSWCKEHNINSTSSTIPEFLLYLSTVRKCKPQTITGYKLAIALIHNSGLEISNSSELSSLIKGLFNMNPPIRQLTPNWNLPLVLLMLTKHPFEPLDSVELKFLTFKTAYLVAIALASRKNHHNESSKDSTARWIVNTVRYAYENTNKDTLKTVRAHDTRRLSTSWALFCGVYAEEILKAAHWTFETTFTSFYLKDVPDHQSIFAKSAILDSFKRGRQK